MRSPSSSGSEILYSDRLVTITRESITFARYSFPFAGSRKIAFPDIDHISVMEPSLTNGKWRIWGSGDLRTWFPLDIYRLSREKVFFVSMKSGSTKIGFTVEDSSRVIALLEELGFICTLSCDHTSSLEGSR